jgi:hypothetical protein
MNEFGYNEGIMGNEHFARSLWIGFGIIVASIIIAGGALYFFAGDLSANASAIVSAREALDEQNTAVANLASLKQQKTRAAQYQAAMDQLVPDQYGLVTFTQWFVTQGTQHNVEASANFQGSANPSGGDTPGTAPFTFIATGSLADLTAFLDAVGEKSSNFLISFESLNVTTGNSEYTITGNGIIFSR